ncbi:hypothetical protein VTI74DRAFT_9925 [Chaetomium olivicolor]
MASPQISTTNTSFTYHTLPDDGRSYIRLLELLPGKGSEPIRCNLQVVPLSREVQYEGLSYCWGDPKRTCSISCNNVLFPVTANLHDALRALRKEDKARMLWVDAICINQTSIPERNQQVAIMRDIYRNATRTVVWLGPEGDDSNEALAIIPDLLAVRDKFYGGGHRTAPVGVRSRFALTPEEMDATPELERLIDNTEARAAFLTLLQRPWFSRVWVVQEVTVSFHTTVKCGAVEISFDDLAQAAITFGYLDLHVGIGLRRPLDLFWDIWDTRRKHWDRWANSMFQILLRHRWCHATDPRDKVYALCGIATDAKAEPQHYIDLLAPGWYRSIQPSPLAVVVDEPDYNVATVDVYTQLASKLLTSNLGLDLFSAIHPSVPRLPGLPSWVPDWSASEWFQNFRKSSKNTFFDLEQHSPYWSPMMEDPRPGPGVPPKEIGFVLKGALVGAGRDRFDQAGGLTNGICPHFPGLRRLGARRPGVRSTRIYHPVWDGCGCARGGW